MKSRASSQNATALKSVTSFGTVEVATADQGLGTGVDNSTYGRLYQFSDRQTATSDAAKVQVRHRETIMLAKIRRLSTPRLTELDSIVDRMLSADEANESEREAQALNEFGRSRRTFAKIWDNPEDAEYNKL